MPSRIHAAERSRTRAKAESSDSADGWYSNKRTSAALLMLGTAIAIYLCYRVALPFLPALAWALALAVTAYPLHEFIRSRVAWPNVAAGLAVFLVAAVIVAPAIFVVDKIVREATNYAQTLQDDYASGRLRASLEQNPRLQPVLAWAETQFGLAAPAQPEPAEDKTAATGEPPPADETAETTAAPAGPPSVEKAADMLTRGVGSVVTGTVWFGMQLFTTFLALFFFFRDRGPALTMLRSLLPLSRSEADQAFRRVNDTIYATIYGSVVVALVQGAMGGLIFWWLGLPAPLVWGAVMGLLAVIPVLGTFVIWAPTAAILALKGDWTSAAVLAAWGTIAIGLIDNFLYPFLVGKRMRFHTLLVFLAIVGGLATFGASGIILGPLVLALADALLDVWQARTARADAAAATS
jgi:predicted PurR-regulated permease PerM